jgi:hypothetical protein
MSGRGNTEENVVPQRPVSPEPIKRKLEIRSKPANQESIPSPEKQGKLQEPGPKTVLITKKKLVSQPQVMHLPDISSTEFPEVQEIHTNSPVEAPIPDETGDDMSIAIKDTAFRAKDRVFEGREVRKPKVTTVANDASLLHTALKPKKPAEVPGKNLPVADDPHEIPVPDHAGKKPDKTGKKQDDVTWI